MGNKDKTNKRKKSKVILKVLIVFLLIILILLGIAVGYVINKLNKINHVDINEADITITDGVDTGYRNIVVFGIDTRGDTYEGSRSDCIIIVSINEKTKEVKLVSVYRDTYLEIQNDVGLNKVNSAYAYGGPALAMSTLNVNLDLDITEFVAINFEATKDVIDAIGGIEIEVTDAEAEKITGINSGGKYILSGSQALEYSRIRKIDNDYVRTERMRTVLTAVFNKAKTLSISKLDKLINDLLPEVYTNISSGEILGLASQIYSYDIIQSQGWPYEKNGATLNQVWYCAPVTLESNVQELHKELFGIENYVPTDKVKEISQKIINKTGYNN